MLKNSLLSIFAAGGLALIVLAATADDTDRAEPLLEKTDVEASAAPALPDKNREPTPLSVEPSVSASTILIPPGRPDWVAKKPDRTSEVHTTAVTSGPWSDTRDCQKELDKNLEKAVREYIDDHLRVGDASRLVHYDLKTIKTRLVGLDQYEETVIHPDPVGPMQQVHALVKFDPQFRGELDTRWNEIKSTSRLMQTGLFGGAVLGLLGLVFGYLKLDTATCGYYTGRLQFAAVAAILSLAASGVFLARWIPWM